MSREKELQLVNNILATFEAAPKRPVVQRNPATAEAWVAEVSVPNVGTVKIFHSVVWGEINDTEHLVVSTDTPELGRVEIFRASKVRWWEVKKSSPLAWALFGKAHPQPQPNHSFAMPTQIPVPATL